MAGVEIDAVHVGVVGRAHARRQQPRHGRGRRARTARSRARTCDRVLDAAQAVALPAEREILHVLPQEFVVDEQDGIGEPIGMTGIAPRGQGPHRHRRDQLDAEPDRLRQPRRHRRDGVDARAAGHGRSGADAGRARARGRCSSTSAAAPPTSSSTSAGRSGTPASSPIGGDHFTNDIAIGLRTPLPEAEKIKRRCGCALTTMVGEDETMEVASVGGGKPRADAAARSSRRSCSRAPRRSSTCCGTRSATPAATARSAPASSSPAAAPSSTAWSRSPSRSSTAGPPRLAGRGSAASWITSTRPSGPPPSGC